MGRPIKPNTSLMGSRSVIFYTSWGLMGLDMQVKGSMECLWEVQDPMGRRLHDPREIESRNCAEIMAVTTVRSILAPTEDLTVTRTLQLGRPVSAITGRIKVRVARRVSSSTNTYQVC